MLTLHITEKGVSSGYQLFQTVDANNVTYGGNVYALGGTDEDSQAGN